MTEHKVAVWETPIPQKQLYILKDRIRRPGGGVNGSQFKIPDKNLAYVPNQTQRASLLTWPRSHSYLKVVGPQNQVRNRNQTHKLVQANSRPADPPTSHGKGLAVKLGRLKAQLLTTTLAPSRAFHRTLAVQEKEPEFWSDSLCKLTMATTEHKPKDEDRSRAQIEPNKNIRPKPRLKQEN
jgi:hypothetical protein